MNAINTAQRCYRKTSTLLDRDLALFLKINSTQSTHLRALQARDVNVASPERQSDHRVLAKITVLPQNGQLVE